MPDYSLPRYLQPPSAEEKARIDEASMEAARKSVGFIKRSIGMRRMQAEAQQAVANGVDPVTAKQNALINNAELLFWDNPTAVGSIVNHAEANSIRDRANLQISQARDTANLLKEKLLENQRERNQQMADQAKAKLEETAKHNAALEEARLGRLEEAGRALDIKKQLGEESNRRMEAENEARDLRFKENQNRLKQQGDTESRLKIETMLQKDPIYTGLAEKVTSAQEAVDSAKKRLGSKIPLYGTTQSDVDAAETALDNVKTELNGYRAKVGKKFNVDMSEEDELVKPPKATTPTAQAPKASPATNPPKDLREGAIIKQGGKRYRYIGGDTKDPDSYALIVE